jgi:hypothetical protein
VFWRGKLGHDTAHPTSFSSYREHPSKHIVVLSFPRSLGRWANR